MKYTYLKTMNLSHVYSATNKKVIEIDLTKAKNRFILLVGKNGSGKTAILSLIQPYGLIGSVDLRNNSKLLLDDHDGYIELHLEDKDDKYIIKHYCENVKNEKMKVRPFISKNGVELNPNGNIRSYIEIIKNELSLEPEYIKLVRLGSNITNLIEMKSTERKKFSSQLLSEIDVYTSLYKKLNEDNRIMKTLIGNTSMKISKLNIDSVDVYKQELKDAENSLKYNEDRLDKLKKNKWIIEDRMNRIYEGYDSIDDFNEYYKKIKKRLNYLKEMICNPKYSTRTKEEIMMDIEIIKKKTEDINKELTKQEMVFVNYNDKLRDYYERQDILSSKIDMNCNSSNLDSLTVKLQSMINRRDELRKKYTDIGKISYTKEDIIRYINIGDAINKLSYDFCLYGNDVANEVISLHMKGFDIQTYVDEKTSKIDKKIAELKYAKMLCKGKKEIESIKKNEIEVMYVDPGCTAEKCGYWNKYHKKEETHSKDMDKILKQIKVYEDDREALMSLLKCDRVYREISFMISSAEDLNKKLGVNFITKESIFSNIVVSQAFDRNVMNTYLIIVNELEEYKDIDNTIEKLSLEKDLKERIYKDNENIKIELSEIKSKIENTIVMRDEIHNVLKSMDLEISTNNQSEKILCNELEDLEKLDGYKNEILNLEKEFETLQEKKNDIDKYDEKYMDILRDVRITEDIIQSLDKKIVNMIMNLKDYKTLNNELKLLNDQYKEIKLIRESLSPTKGIPLLFIQLYLKNVKMIVNRLLESVYGDTFQIDDFVISEDEFSIPYRKNGIGISDVMYASQGEKSFLSIALSFALLTRTIQKYNVPLLDEIDATLDSSNRRMFLNILEDQCDIINAEQVFLITHNNMFDDYPVDLILMSSDVKIDNYNNANIIYKIG